jgi:ABC-type multidrug transport system ATPase subunit
LYQENRKGSIEHNSLSMGKSRSDTLEIVGAILEGAGNIYWNLSLMENLMCFAEIRGILLVII